MRITNLTVLGFYINAAIDSGKYDHITNSAVQDEIAAGTIFQFLRDKLGTDIDLSLLDAKKEAQLLTEWQDMVNAIDARRKMGIENRGLTLLMGYLLEGIQRRQDNNPAAI